MNVIAVDDEKLALDTLLDSAAKVMPGTEIHGFRVPEEALEYVRANGCDIAFLDIKMRSMTGLELARKMKDIKGDVNIVFVTGYSEYSLDAFRMYASDYLLKPATPEAVQSALEHLRNPIRPANEKKLRFQCFGNFEVYVDGRPLSFARSKTKEMLAYLVDRMGAAVTTGELMAVLWESGTDTPSRHSNLRNLVSDLKHTFSEICAEDVIIKSRNTLAINCEKVDCDYYDFLHHIPYAVNCYHGEYMMQYSWAEITTASLSNFHCV